MSGSEPPPRLGLGPWPVFREQARPTVDWQSAKPVLCLDPGETTGWSVWDQGLLEVCGQWDTPDPPAIAREIRHMADTYPLRHLVFESYRIRGNKAQQHVGSEVITIQLIGAIRLVADELGIPWTSQTAGEAKGFATDAKLKMWGLYQKGLRHANDSIRHGVYYFMFRYGRKR